MPKLNITFHYGSLADPLAEQAKKQGFTLKNSDKIQHYLNVLTELYFDNVFTYSQWDKVLERFQKRVVIPNLNILEEDEE